MGRNKKKQEFTLPVWADEICVEQKQGTLIVKGKRHPVAPRKNIAIESDLLRQSIPAARWSQDDERRKKTPHVMFANATTDDKLIDFVRTWGPVDGDVTSHFRPNKQPIQTEGVPKGKVKFTKNTPGLEVVTIENGRTKRMFFPDVRVTVRYPNTEQSFELEVKQNVAEVRAEQELFAGVARLIAEIQRGDKDRRPEKIIEHCTQTARAIPLLIEERLFYEQAEVLMRNNKHRSITRALSQLAESFLCTVLNEFPARLFPTVDGPVELPPLDANTFGRGIKHAMYGLLRLEYLRSGRVGLGVCRNCAEVFAMERRGAIFCGEVCSHLYRSKDYYHLRGKAARQARTKLKVTATGDGLSTKRNP
jgi:hypothetical protein